MTKQELPSTSSLEALAENLREIEQVNLSPDSIEDQLRANLKNIVTGLVLVVLAAVGVRFMLDARERSKGAASQRFELAQRDFQELFIDGTKTDASRLRAFEDKLRATTDVDSRSTYAQLSELYRAAGQFRGGSLDEALAIVARYKPEQLRSEGRFGAEDFKLELALLLKGKILVSTSKPEGETLLREIAQKGRALAGEALLTHQRLFPADPELISQVFSRSPHLRDQISDELSLIGVKINE
jgi:hypothetical protein